MLKIAKTKYLTASRPILGTPSIINAEELVSKKDLRNIHKIIEKELNELLNDIKKNKKAKVLTFTSYQLSRPLIKKIVIQNAEKFGRVEVKELNLFHKIVHTIAFEGLRLRTMYKLNALPKKYRKNLYEIKLIIDI